MTTTAKNVVFLLLVLAAMAAIFPFFGNAKLLVDENDNYAQITNFLHHDFRLLEISALPGYHFLVTAIAMLFGFSSVYEIRIVTAVIGYLSVCVYLFLSVKIHGKTDFTGTLQYLLMPIIFVFLFLIYTDIASLMAVMLMVHAVLDRKYTLAALYGLASMLFRQNNVIWILFAMTLSYAEQYGHTLSISNLKASISRFWLFLVCVMLFILFVIFNHGVAVGDAASHPAFKFSTGNIFFLLFTIFVMLLPLQAAALPKVYSLLTEHKWLFALLLIIFILYWFSYHPDHPYNRIEPQYYMRNLILTRVQLNSVYKLCFFFPVAYALLFLMVTPFISSKYYLIYPFTILFLAPSWLVEQRYYLIPLVLLMSFRKKSSVLAEWITIGWFLVILYLMLPLLWQERIFF
ncbi:MAG TPA: hypothetical protein VFW78_08290 [Bacteroidia bacterium]|nr:hypothetical protein [Bacteroidia bacterium]